MSDYKTKIRGKKKDLFNAYALAPLKKPKAADLSGPTTPSAS